MSLYETLFKPALFALPAETAHNLGLAAIAAGLVHGEGVDDPRLAETHFGCTFPNPLGLAAGFDKNAVAVDDWHRLGFGFVEIGTVTERPQPGNPMPRLFRVPEDQALINRMGFNNEGSRRVADRLARAEPRIPLGVNLGKSKVTPLEKAVDDYASSFERLAPHADYVVVNVSSPNTPGLRSLQEKGPLTEILQRLKDLDFTKPLFVKVAPDLTLGELDDVVEVVHTVGLTGIVATNTTLDRSKLAHDPGEAGGLSGKPLLDLADETLQYLVTASRRDVILIGVGGIFTGDDLYRKIALGAHLCQLYTGFVYRGPAAAGQILREFLARLDREGIRSLVELRGTATEA